ncbi:MAG: NADH-quinone oxidoreductase subunit H [Candidatus Pacebacteria bacterium]|nr:NADH-quinone oxidoreductase subunit H [Candidatus Paceibacterota bacterium]
MALITIYFLQALAITALSPLLVGGIRKIKAYYQGREGARITQPYRDLRKLFGKDEVIPEDASWVFYGAPYIVFGTTLAVASGVPLILMGNTGSLGNIFVMVYTLALGTFFLGLAGMDAGSSFGGFGSSREMTFSAIAEGVLLFSFLPLGLLASSSNIGDIALYVRELSFTEMLPVVVAFVGFFIALLAETGRVPIDNPATHLELTMVHEAMLLEYSGKRLALMEWANANKLMIFVAIAGSVFFPWGVFDARVPFDMLAAMTALGVFVFKCGMVAFGIATIESMLAKLRIFRIPRLLFAGLIIGAVAFALVAV